MIAAFRAFCVAFSTYSVIPVPQVIAKEKELPYVMCFFPVVGAVIGAVFYGWSYLCVRFGIPDFVRTAVGCAIPLILSGGIHADGFMDTSDALHSYGDASKKQEILKDPHIGAFAVIRFTILMLLFAGAMYLTKTSDAAIVSGCFFMSRVLSALGVLTLPLAKKEGMLYSITAGEKRTSAVVIVVIEGIACAAFLCACSLPAGVAVLFAACAVFIMYRRTAISKFGGNSGDLAGWFLCRCTCAEIICVAVTGLTA